MKVFKVFFNLEHNVPEAKIKIPKEISCTFTPLKGGMSKTRYFEFPNKFKKKFGKTQDFYLKDQIEEYIEKRNKHYRVSNIEFLFE